LCNITRNVHAISLNKTSFLQIYQLHVSANDGSHHQADNKNIKWKYLQLRWWLKISIPTNVAP